MSLARRAARRDDNEKAIVDALREHGATVVQLSGKGVPDLLVGWRNAVWLLIEIKTERGELTPDQRIWHATCRGPKPYIARSVTDAIACLHMAISEGP